MSIRALIVVVKQSEFITDENAFLAWFVPSGKDVALGVRSKDGSKAGALLVAFEWAVANGYGAITVL